jgi:hypothetical protein
MQLVSRQRCGNHASITIELLFVTVFSAQYVQSDCKEDNWGYPIRIPCTENHPVWRWGRIPPQQPCEPSAWGYNRATLPGGYKYGNLALQVGEVSDLRQ